MNYFFNNILFSPFDGFKTEAYYYEISRMSEIFYINSWFENNIINNFQSLKGFFFFSWIFFIIFIYLVEDTNNQENIMNFNWKYIVKVTLSVLLITGLTSWGPSHTLICTVFEKVDSVYMKFSMMVEMQSFLMLVIKDLWTFIIIALGIYLFTSQSYTNLRLFPVGGLDALGESLYKFSLDLFANILEIKKDEHSRKFQEFFLKINAIFLFILGANLVGMVPYATTITSSFANTFFIALALFINIIATMIGEKGVNYFFSLFLPGGCPVVLIPLLVPIEFISYIFRLISLSVRLFANMLAGHTLIKVIAGFSWSLILLGDGYILLHYFPVILLFALTILEIGVAFIQAYVFTVLSYLYTRDIFAGH